MPNLYAETFTSITQAFRRKKYSISIEYAIKRGIGHIETMHKSIKKEITAFVSLNNDENLFSPHDEIYMLKLVGSAECF